MRHFIIILLFFHSAGLSEKLILAPGEKILLPLPPDQKIRIGNKSLIAFQKKGGQLSLLARKEGQSLLIAGNKHYEVFIFNKETKQKALILDKLLKNFWGLDWSLSEKNIFQIHGQLNRLHDWIDLAEISKAHNIFYEFKALPGENLKKPIRHYFNQLFKNKATPEIAWNKLPSAYIPQGSSLLEYTKELQPFGLNPEEDSLWLSSKPFIEIELAVVESISSSGFSWGGKNQQSDSLMSFKSLLAFLNFLKNSGQGKTLHHSSIITQSGQKLQIQSGGQIPFNNYNIRTEQKNTEWKAHGLYLDIIPKAGKKGQIELDINAQLSEPLAFNSMNGPPPLKTQSLKNKLILKNKQILKLFHLKKQFTSSNNQGQLSFLLDLPRILINASSKQEVNQLIFIQARFSQNKSIPKEKHQSLCKEKNCRTETNKDNALTTDIMF